MERLDLEGGSPASRAVRDVASSSVDLTPEQARNRALIEDHLYRTTLGGVGRPLGVVGVGEPEEGERVELGPEDLAGLTDEVVMGAVVETGLMDLMREVNNAASLLAEAAARKREGSRGVRAAAGALWVICAEEIARLGSLVSGLCEAGGVEVGSGDVGPWGARRQGGLDLVELFREELERFEGKVSPSKHLPGRAGRAGASRHKRELAVVVTSFLKSLHAMLTVGRGDDGSMPGLEEEWAPALMEERVQVLSWFVEACRAAWPSRSSHPLRGGS